MHHTRIASLILIGLAACTDAPDATGPATTGIYELEARAIADSCEPAAALGTSTVALVRFADGLSYAYPGERVAGSASLVREVTGADLRDEFDLPLAGSCARGRLHHLFAVGYEAPDRVEATLDRTWRDVVHCAGDPIDATLPAAACASRRELTYQLLEPCAAPCQIVDDDGAPVCRC